MNTYARSRELDRIAADVLDNLGLSAVTNYEALSPAVVELRKRTEIRLSTARSVIARHIRKYRGVIVGDYQVMDVTTLPYPPDAEPVPLVLIHKVTA